MSVHLDAKGLATGAQRIILRDRSSSGSGSQTSGDEGTYHPRESPRRREEGVIGGMCLLYLVSNKGVERERL